MNDCLAYSSFVVILCATIYFSRFWFSHNIKNMNKDELNLTQSRWEGVLLSSIMGLIVTLVTEFGDGNIKFNLNIIIVIIILVLWIFMALSLLSQIKRININNQK
ncbi:hypothetical protein CRV00_11970 [Malaciobacter molluscorum]|uniref:hypothetical protein n=1 Tax=Malaciobacter molluscorum TaxID=1032072 RepID=UPI00100BCADA|nr:hypothetical protein [Malaciobacter molluscorum]RXJ92858.1 hypothetical protein CRV00_11970 [Malaciobacter molluscorum]